MVAGRSGAEKQVASPFGRLKTIGAAHGITGCARAERAARDVGESEAAIFCLALGVAGWLFLALCFYRCCCRRRKPPHKRLVEPDEEEARGGMPSPRPKRRSDALHRPQELAEQLAELKLRMKEVGELERRLSVSKAQGRK